MAAAPENGMLQPPGPPPIGEILVQRGLLTREQLATALAESTRTGRRVGEVIVQLGFALPGTIAQALAEQHGGLVKTEYGYAVGFGTGAPSTASGPPPVSSEPEARSTGGPVPALRTVSAVAPAPVSESAVVVAAAAPVPAAAAPVPAAAAPAVAAPAVAEQISGHEVSGLRERLEQLAGELEAAQAETRVVAAERGALQQQLEAAVVRIAELEAAEAAAIQRAHDESRSQLTLLEAKLDEREQALSAALAEAARAEKEKDGVEQAREAAVRRAAELEAAAVDAGELERELMATRAQAASAESGSGKLEEELLAARTRAERADAEIERLERTHEEAASQIADLGRQLREREAAVQRLADLESATAERSELERALAAAREHSASAEREKATLEQRHAAAKTRLAELESVIAAGNDLERQLEAAHERARLAEAENERLERAHDASAAQIDQLERRLQEVEHRSSEPDGSRLNVTGDPTLEEDLAAALARNKELVRRLADAMTLVSELETERKDTLAIARALSGLSGGAQQFEKQDDPASHYLFVAERSGYRLVEAEGLPPIQGATLELQASGGTITTYVVARVGAAPFPGARIPCAYLVAE